MEKMSSGEVIVKSESTPKLTPQVAKSLEAAAADDSHGDEKASKWGTYVGWPFVKTISTGVFIAGGIAGFLESWIELVEKGKVGGGGGGGAKESAKSGH